MQQDNVREIRLREQLQVLTVRDTVYLYKDGKCEFQGLVGKLTDGFECEVEENGKKKIEVCSVDLAKTLLESEVVELRSRGNGIIVIKLRSTSRNF